MKNEQLYQTEELQNTEVKLWLLVQYEKPSHVYNYAIIDSVDVMQSKCEKMHTGKTIDIRVGKTVILKAIIFIISDDRSFLETELRQLLNSRNIQQTNGSSSSTTNTDTIHNSNGNSKKEVASYKRKRQQDGKSEYVLSTRKSPSPAWSPRTNDHSNQSFETQKSTASSSYCPPMTFDQQTQTDTKLLPKCEDSQIQANIANIMSIQEKILAEQKNARIESQHAKQQLAEINDKTTELRKLLEEVLQNIYSNGSQIVEPIPVDEGQIDETPEKSKNPVILYTCNSNSTKASNEILNLSNSQLNEVAIETIDMSSNGEYCHNSNSSYSNGRRYSTVVNSFTQNSSFSPIHHNNSPSVPTSLIRVNSNSSKKAKKNYKEILTSDWNEDNATNGGEDEEEEVAIGSNGSMVKLRILNNIKWASYSNATRKLLTTFFSRETLATHSLTGKPSPAFMESNKPTKHQLNPLIIGDIIQIVTKRCNVTETVVRSSITTKCADENKMLRQRMQKRKVLQNLDNIDKENKINLSAESHQDIMSQTM